MAGAHVCISDGHDSMEEASVSISYGHRLIGAPFYISGLEGCLCVALLHKGALCRWVWFYINVVLM